MKKIVYERCPNLVIESSSLNRCCCFRKKILFKSPQEQGFNVLFLQVKTGSSDLNGVVTLSVPTYNPNIITQKGSEQNTTPCWTPDQKGRKSYADLGGIA